MVRTVQVRFTSEDVSFQRMFTPVLSKNYEAWNAAGKKVAVLFASADMNATAFGKYYGHMPWHAIPFGDPRKAALEAKCGVQGLPTLVVLNSKGQVVREDAVNDVKEKGEAVLASWSS